MGFRQDCSTPEYQTFLDESKIWTPLLPLKWQYVRRELHNLFIDLKKGDIDSLLLEQSAWKGGSFLDGSDLSRDVLVREFAGKYFLALHKIYPCDPDKKDVTPQRIDYRTLTQVNEGSVKFLQYLGQDDGAKIISDVKVVNEGEYFNQLDPAPETYVLACPKPPFALLMSVYPKMRVHEAPWQLLEYEPLPNDKKEEILDRVRFNVTHSFPYC